MTRSRELEQRRQTLGEIRDIMNSMKSLAYMETRKLTQFLDAQRTVVSNIESVANDFFGYYPCPLPLADGSPQISLLIGSERGFCGDFNEIILEELEMKSGDTDRTPLLIVAGRKLCNRLEDDSRVVAFIDGASVVEEVEPMLYRFTKTLASLQVQYSQLSLRVFHHDPDTERVVVKELLPPFQQHLDTPARFPHPPVLNLSPKDFLADLVDHYLFAALHEIVFISLMAENLRRVQHLEGAVRHLDDESTELLRRGNALRQEEIIEEIEVILLSTSGLAHAPHKNKER